MNVLVLGASFIDIKGFPFGKYVGNGTNIGRVVTLPGGAARNAAEDFVNIGVHTEFMTMLDKTPYGMLVEDALRQKGIGLNYSLKLKEDGIGMWLAVFTENGELAGSISVNRDFTPLRAHALAAAEEAVAASDFVIVEMDCSEEISEHLFNVAQKYLKPVYVLSGNMSVILKRPDLAARADCIILNDIEAGRLFNISLEGLDAQSALAAVREHGTFLKRLIVTLGAQGCVYADFGQDVYGMLHSQKCDVKDTTGAGDAFFAAASTALAMGKDIKSAAKCGTALAALTIQSESAACPKTDITLFC